MSLRQIIWLLFGLTALISMYLRFAPTEPERWHVDPAAAPDPRPRGYRTEVTISGDPEELLQRLTKISGTFSRTRIYAGDAASGRITFLTHSSLMGFPDYTTVSAVKNGKKTQMVFLGRLRFGWSDIGVNRRRIQTWIKTLQAIQE